MRLMHMMITLIVRPLVINVLLAWSTRWKEYNTQSFKDLRRVVNRSIDPLYPSGEQPVASSSKDVKAVLSSSSLLLVMRDSIIENHVEFLYSDYLLPNSISSHRFCVL